MTENPKRATELEWLEYFYSAAGDAFGPAESDIYDSIKRYFMRSTGKRLPEGYGIYVYNEETGEEDEE